MSQRYIERLLHIAGGAEGRLQYQHGNIMGRVTEESIARREKGNRKKIYLILA